MRLKHLPPVMRSPARARGKILSLCLPARVPLQELQRLLARVPEGLAEGEDVLSLSCYLPLLHNEPRPVGVMLNEVMEGDAWTTDSNSQAALLLFEPPSPTEQQYKGFSQSWKTVH
ncbi:hypothetical protein QQF64_021258 [Cirrhinus molitorella]|uniref:Uncharacterized protein n=1 Tax=Cirrhinus molitorella TaxID=172907 RepID=A0ABR3LBM4_9TELE